MVSTIANDGDDGDDGKWLYNELQPIKGDVSKANNGNCWITDNALAGANDIADKNKYDREKLYHIVYIQ